MLCNCSQVLRRIQRCSPWGGVSGDGLLLSAYRRCLLTLRFISVGLWMDPYDSFWSSCCALCALVTGGLFLVVLLVAVAATGAFGVDTGRKYWSPWGLWGLAMRCTGSMLQTDRGSWTWDGSMKWSAKLRRSLRPSKNPDVAVAFFHERVVAMFPPSSFLVWPLLSLLLSDCKLISKTFREYQMPRHCPTRCIVFGIEYRRSWTFHIWRTS